MSDAPTKYDTGKPRLDLIPAQILHQLVQPAGWNLGAHTTHRVWCAWWDQAEESLPYNELVWATQSFLRTLNDPWKMGGLGCVAAVASRGAEKYGDWNWCIPPGFKWSRLWASVCRHRMVVEASGDPALINNEDFGLPHTWHETWGYVALLTYMHYGLGEDDRPCLVKQSETSGS